MLGRFEINATKFTWKFIIQNLVATHSFDFEVKSNYLLRSISFFFFFLKRKIISLIQTNNTSIETYN